MDVLQQLVVSAVLLGGVYALLSIGLTLIFGVVRIVNFAHGHFVMLGMYTSYWLWRAGVDPYLSAPLVFLVFCAVGGALHHFIVRRTLTMPHLVQVFVTFGIAIVIEALTHLAWGGDFRFVRLEYASRIVPIGQARVVVGAVIAFAVAVLATGAIHVFLQRTDTGKAIRATAQDPYAAQAMGIDVARVFNLTFGLGVGSAAFAGSLLVPLYPAFPSVGLGYALIAFVVVVLGGLGSLPGALIGGLLVALIETFTAFQISPSFKEGMYFLLFIGVLVLRPAGLLGLRGSELVGVNR